MESIIFQVRQQSSLVELVDEIEDNFWPKVPIVTYQVAGAGSKENAMQLAKQYVLGHADGASNLLLGMSVSVGMLCGVAGYLLGSYIGNNWHISLALLGGFGGFFIPMLRSPKRIDIALRLAQAVQEGRYFAVPALPEPEEEVPFEMVRTGNKI